MHEELVATLHRKVDDMQERIARMSSQMEEIMQAFNQFEEFTKRRYCYRKGSYATQKEVRTVINEIKSKGRARSEQLRYYRCELCQKYHLTKSTEE